MPGEAGRIVHVPREKYYWSDTTKSVAEPEVDRLFLVHRKATRPLQVHAKTVQIHESGALIFQDGGDLVMAVGPHSWSLLEESEDE